MQTDGVVLDGEIKIEMGTRLRGAFSVANMI